MISIFLEVASVEGVANFLQVWCKL